MKILNTRIWLVLWLVIATSACSTLPTEPRLPDSSTQGGLIIGQLPQGWRVMYGDKWLPLTEDGMFVLGFGRDNKTTAALILCPPVGECYIKRLNIQAREYEIQYIEGVAQRFVTPNPEQVKRSQQDNRMVGRARRVVSNREDFRGSFIWPVKGIITGVYGSQRFFNGEPRRPHFGIDIAAAEGTPVKAPLDGKVTLAAPDMYFSGGTMIIDHGHGLSSTMIHLQRLLVEEGQEVRQGEVIATVGATGRVTGAHLDWRVYWLRTPLDPQLLVPPMDLELPVDDG